MPATHVLIANLGEIALRIITAFHPGYRILSESSGLAKVAVVTNW